LGLPPETVEKGKAFFDKGLRPAAAHILSADSGQNPRLQAEKCFFLRPALGGFAP
jgi:hypothetical protein